MSTCSSSVTKYFIVQPEASVSGQTIQGDLTVVGNILNCSGGTIFTETIDPCFTGVTISSNFTVFQDVVEPVSDDTKTLGTPSRRWRQINTVSGSSTVWTSTSRVITPRLELGLDSNSEDRTITADNSIIQDDFLNGGTY